MEQPTDQQLAEDIFAFLDTYAKTAGDYDPEYDDPGERFNGPDSSMLWAAAQALLQGNEPPQVLSSYGSGCYKWPNSDGEAEHIRLLAALSYRRDHGPVSDGGFRR
jgi:hypothetical protein